MPNGLFWYCAPSTTQRRAAEVRRRGEVRGRDADERLAGLDHGIGLHVGATRHEVDLAEALVGVVAALVGDVHARELDVLHPGQLVVEGAEVRVAVALAVARVDDRRRRTPASSGRAREPEGGGSQEGRGGACSGAVGSPKVPSSEASTVSTCWDPSTEPPSITRFWPVR